MVKGTTTMTLFINCAQILCLCIIELLFYIVLFCRGPFCPFYCPSSPAWLLKSLLSIRSTWYFANKSVRTVHCVPLSNYLVVWTLAESHININMTKINSKGPSTEPCWTPETTGNQSELQLSTVTLCRIQTSHVVQNEKPKDFSMWISYGPTIKSFQKSK